MVPFCFIITFLQTEKFEFELDNFFNPLTIVSRLSIVKEAIVKVKWIRGMMIEMGHKKKPFPVIKYSKKKTHTQTHTHILTYRTPYFENK